MVYIYILELEQGKYYVGKTNDPETRINKHFDLEGSAWTKKYKPIREIQRISNCDNYDEDKYTLKYMDMYGIENVRGGSFVTLSLDESTITYIKSISKSNNNQKISKETDNDILIKDLLENNILIKELLEDNILIKKLLDDDIPEIITILEKNLHQNSIPNTIINIEIKEDLHQNDISIKEIEKDSHKNDISIKENDLYENDISIKEIDLYQNDISIKEIVDDNTEDNIVNFDENIISINEENNIVNETKKYNCMILTTVIGFIIILVLFLTHNK